MRNYIITFPFNNISLRDGWVKVTAPDIEKATSFANSEFDGKYANIYHEEDFTEGYYPLGCFKEFSVT